MAIYHLTVKIFTRSKGHSAIACAAYRHGERFHDLRTGQVMDYSRRNGVVDSMMLAPDHAPSWVYDREALWNRVEARENNSTRPESAQLAREVEVSLPRELSWEKNKQLVKEYVTDQFISKGMVADVAFHESVASDGRPNPHAHIMLTMRELKGWEFGNKMRGHNPIFTKGDQVKDKKPLKILRETWSQYVNQALQDSGSRESVDHRSYDDRSINRIPEPKLGAAIRLEKTNPWAAERVAHCRKVRAWNRAQATLENAEHSGLRRANRRRLHNEEWLREFMHGHMHERVPSPEIIAPEYQGYQPHTLEPDR
ncbi:MAG: MobQ family relaxase [Candidatus Competibacteraceae bacterium]|jgi:hypothetical protein|nr:MobQ family relaxase [Candidatus Competibacteraceae bacterium]